MLGELLQHVVGAVLGFVLPVGLAHRHRERLLDLAVSADDHLVRLVVDGGDQRITGAEARLGAARVDVDRGVGRPEIDRAPPHLGIAHPVEPARHRRVGRDVDRLLGHRAVGDRPLEIDDDRLGHADHGAVDRVEGRRQEHRLAGERRRVLACGGAFRNRSRWHCQRVRRRRWRERVDRRQVARAGRPERMARAGRPEAVARPADPPGVAAPRVPGAARGAIAAAGSTGASGAGASAAGTGPGSGPGGSRFHLGICHC